TPPSDFQSRHLGPRPSDVDAMLHSIGVGSVDELIDQTIPQGIRRMDTMEMPAPMNEQELIEHLRGLADQNQVYQCHIGMGYYPVQVPGVIQRNILENPGWYTQYTPYQSEIAQGRLEALLNFQTLVCDLTGMDIANASLLDESTAAAEAMLMLFAQRNQVENRKFFVSNKVFPQTRAVLQTRAEPLGIELVFGRVDDFAFDEGFFGMIFQYPEGYGRIRDYKETTKKAAQQQISVAVIADPMALVLLESPGSWGADVVVGSMQRFGVPMGYGGPHAAYFATRDAFKRNLPGRLIGVSRDAQGRVALRMALQTREQHIRREKATSNICTAQVLLAIMSSMYAVYHGPDGLKEIALRIHRHAAVLDAALQIMGFKQVNPQYFDTLQVELPEEELQKLKNIAEGKRINLNFLVPGQVGVSVDETTSLAQLVQVALVFAAITNGKRVDLVALDRETTPNIHPDFMRKDEILQHPVFHSYRSEHQMLRYIKRLESRDLSLCHSMIPLGSCTMKLNATTEMIAVTWAGFAHLHPFAPVEQAMGYKSMFDMLTEDLRQVTGFPGISLQPNSGAQGEYAGLMVIRAYHLSRGEGHRNIALIPSSAHGTNPASAVMAGMQVVVVACDERGNISLDDLKTQASRNADRLAALMVTYPSTHGVFETTIREICSVIHEYGGQVYMDGANMNAQVGLTSPALIGADVCHLNLHKTFCIPHGGGGPGMGPIGVAAHLTPFLPSHPVVAVNPFKSAITPVSGAPWGSAGILPISYAYARMMGGAGLTEATRMAIVNANYIMARLKGAFSVLYTGPGGHCAHEMIIDLRPFKASAGIEVEDVAKRLMDYGFHAPTVSFPVAGTIMIEPTESEDKPELDRFCDAMLHIREEIREIEMGIYDRDLNVLKHAPHTAFELVGDWLHPYPREKAVFPLPWVRESKFWPTVGRVNNTHGDRNLFCVCPPIELYDSVS
ncbi:MAG: aminomethyl-transferring glycine dehydrogenase, partial [Sphingomonadales bacterium]|nr:aminomethyl-transferring glycine dehydrogenase [Sphingomonadales bacterium]